MRISEDVLDLGLYTSDCCSQELIFDTGDTFCRCPRCENLCRWELESRITPIDSLETDVTAEESQYAAAGAAVA